MSTLYVKVAVSRRPVSNKARAIRILASYDERATVNNALFYAELSLTQLNKVSLQEVVRRAQVECRARTVSVKVNTDVGNYFS